MGIDVIPTYPSGYDGAGTTNNPQGSETRREGDDQIRVLKANINQATPNWSGAVNATHEEVNRLVGISLTNPIITLPSTTTKMVFYQDSAPPEWTIDTALDEHSLRITQGSGTGGVTGGTSGGTVDFGTVVSITATDDFTLLETHIPVHDHGGGSHIHGLNVANAAGNTGLSGAPSFASTDSLGDLMGFNIFSGTSNLLVTAPTTTVINSYGGGSPHAHSIDLRVKWAACIVCTKN